MRVFLSRFLLIPLLLILTFGKSNSYALDYECPKGDILKRSAYVCEADGNISDKKSKRNKIEKDIKNMELTISICKKRFKKNKACNNYIEPLISESLDFYQEVLTECAKSYPMPQNPSELQKCEATEARPFCRIFNNETSFANSSKKKQRQRLAEAKRKLKKLKIPLKRRKSSLEKEIIDNNYTCEEKKKKDDEKDPKKCIQAPLGFGFGNGFGGGFFNPDNLPICPQPICNTCFVDMRPTCPPIDTTTSSSSATDNNGPPVECNGPPLPSDCALCNGRAHCTETPQMGYLGVYPNVHQGVTYIEVTSCDS